jgi:hypothetical protein
LTVGVIRRLDQLFLSTARSTPDNPRLVIISREKWLSINVNSFTAKENILALNSDEIERKSLHCVATGAGIVYLRMARESCRIGYIPTANNDESYHTLLLRLSQSNLAVS